MTQPLRILLTGGTGFVGRAVLERLLGEGHEIVATAHRRAAPLEHPRLIWERLDLLDPRPEEIARMVRSHGLTHCLHAAWYTEHADYLVAEVNRDWLAAGRRLADAFFDAGGRRFVGLGTCVEYAPSGGRCNEDDTPLDPQTLYGQCKLELFRHLQASPDFAWTRLFFIYGPGDRPGRLVPHILDRLSRGEQALASFGGLRRDYLHVDDAAAQLSAVLTGDVQGAVNTGSGSAVPIADIFTTCAELFGRPDLVETNDTVAPGQPELIEADLDKYRRHLGEPPARPLRDGLRQLVQQAVRS